MAKGVGVHWQKFPTQISFGQEVQVSGQATLLPQLFVLFPHSVLAHVPPAGSSTQMQLFEPSQELSGLEQVNGQFTRSPQLLVAVPQAIPLQVTATGSGTQLQVFPTHTSAGPHADVPQSTGSKQLFKVIPHSTPAQEAAVDSGMQ
ncbi:MAG: hypothetical protein KC897_08565 [Candidatus Omnitrophica bacterium]|nr:hypothetical protein [Candidatus Omnitrophota bacterium]MCB9720795.1 hypothetical protein [Candidatus Omnitrophota bacterium]